MAITLLDMLLNAGLITRVQFDDALKNRVIFGGKIGTSLIELGYISEEELAHFLGDKLAVPYVPPSQLLTVPQHIIDLLPRELALKYGVIPLKLEKKRLSLVMSDPADLKAIDEIGFITGFIIRPLITPEVRLVQALSKYYQASMPPRYRHIIEMIEAENQLATPTPPQQPSAPIMEQEPLEIEIDIAEPLLPSRQGLPDTMRPVPEQEEELEELEIVEEVAWAEKLRHFEPDTVSKGLAYAENSEEIADLIITELGSKLKRVALFRIKNHMAICWKGVDQEMAIYDVDQVRLPLDEPSALKTVTESASFYLGPLQETPINHLLNDALGGGHPQTVLAMPLIVSGRVVNILYAEGYGDMSSMVPELQKLLTKAALAFEMLIFRDKILML
jgi:hypothetical protein